VSWTIVGIDCATQEERTGLARAVLDDRGHIRVERVTLGTAGESAAALVGSWIREAPAFVVAMDAPLGWPTALGPVLTRHQAGKPIRDPADALFRRATDSFVQVRLKKTPMEVGADRIARTARAALLLLEQIRKQAERPVPLAWRPGIDSGAIEVYPAATLMTRNLPAKGYKAQSGPARKLRDRILERLGEELDLEVSIDLLRENTDLLDAALCALAGADFARGLCVGPPDLARAKKEGWIWFRGTGQKELFSRGKS
jgi:predicted RNase H-like nuclease